MSSYCGGAQIIGPVNMKAPLAATPDLCYRERMLILIYSNGFSVV